MSRIRTVLWLAVLMLIAIGLTVLASAGEAVGVRLHDSRYYFLTHQAVWLGIALPMMLAAAYFDYRKWREHPMLTVALYVVICVLMVAVLGTRAINGSHRWLSLGPIRLQPSELAKLVTVIATAVFLDKAAWKIELFWKGALPGLGIIGILMGLAVVEPDFGSTMVIGLTGCVMLFLGGIRLLHLGAMSLLGLAGVGGLLISNGNRMRRIAAWLPDGAKTWLSANCTWLGDLTVSDKDAEEANHQLNQALVAIRRGEVNGVGFGNSMQKQLYLPENHTDFIFAIGAEEWGIYFSLLLLVLFVVVFVCGIIVSMKATDRLGRLMAFGMTFVIFFQAIFNMGVVTGLLPTKGLALPFVSYGGTNLMTALIAVGVIWGIARRTGLKNEGRTSKLSAIFQ